MITVKPHDRVPYATILKVSVKRPAIAKSYWQGLKHGTLVKSIKREIDLRGWTITDEVYTLSPNGSEMTGAIQLRIPDIKPVVGNTFAVGFSNANNTRRSVRIAVGSVVHVCQNGMVSGEFSLVKKHTKGLDLEVELPGTFDQILKKAKKLHLDIQTLKELVIPTTYTVDHLLMSASRGKLLPWSHIGDVWKEWKDPTYPDFAPRTAWSLLNAFTHVVKKSNPLKQIHASAEFRELLLAV